MYRLFLLKQTYILPKGKRLQVRFFGKFELEILFILKCLGYAKELILELLPDVTGKANATVVFAETHKRSLVELALFRCQFHVCCPNAALRCIYREERDAHQFSLGMSASDRCDHNSCILIGVTIRQGASLGGNIIPAI